MIHMLERLAVSVNCIGQATCETGLPKVDLNNNNLQVALQLIFGVIGALAVVMIIVGAIKYITAEGNPQSAAKARGTIIYAVIGLVVALMAEAIVTFTLSNI